MGMGEPLHNYDNLTRALALLEHPGGRPSRPAGSPSRRRGWSPGSTSWRRPNRSRGQGSAPNLAISLNATTDEVRDRIMPINKRWPIAALLEAARRFPLSHGRRVTFEYVMLGGVNDSDADADRLPGLLRGIPSKVNLIPWNGFAGPEFVRPPAERIRTFQERLPRRRRRGLHPLAPGRRHRRRLRAARGRRPDAGTQASGALAQIRTVERWPPTTS